MTSTKQSSQHLAFRLLDWPVLVIAALCALGALAAVLVANQDRDADKRTSIMTVDPSASSVPLVDENGRRLTWGALTGAPRAVFFGFTHCPEVCPTTVAALSAAIERLGPQARNLRVDFVSLDPTRDTPVLLKAYFSGFGRRFHGYTGTEGDIARLARAYQVSYERVPTSGGDYTLNHTAIVYLVNPHGEVVDLLTYDSPPERVVAQLRRLIAVPNIGA